MHVNRLHTWDMPPDEAMRLQLHLAERLRDEPIVLERVRLVAGVDVSVKDNVSQAAVVVLSYPELATLEVVRAQRPTNKPYLPGLLTFREGEVLIEAFEKLQHEPDVFLFDGMGRLHPRQMGIAAHLGLWLDKPTIGCGKTHYIGTYDMPPPIKGMYRPVTHNNAVLGAIVTTRNRVKPVYISAGHRATLETSIAFVLSVTSKHRLPVPIRLAHQAAAQ